MGVGDVRERRDHAVGRARAGRARCGRPAARRGRARACPSPPGSVQVEASVEPSRRRAGRCRSRPAARGAAERAGAAADRCACAPGHAAHGAPQPRRSRVSRVAWRATHAHRDRRRRAPSRRARPTISSRARAERQRHVARGQPRQRRTEHEPLEQRSRRSPPGTTSASTAPASSRRTARAAGAARAQRPHRPPALLDGQRARLDQRVQADEAVDDRDRAQDRAQHGDQRHAAADRAGGGRSARRSPSAARHRGRVRARVQHDRELLDGAPTGPAASSARRGHVGDAAVVVERADDAGDAQPQLVAGRRARSRASTRRSARAPGQPEADLGLAAGRATAWPDTSGGASNIVWSPG